MLILAFRVCHSLLLNASSKLYNLFLKHVTSIPNRLFYHCCHIQYVLFFLCLGLWVWFLSCLEFTLTKISLVYIVWCLVLYWLYWYRSALMLFFFSVFPQMCEFCEYTTRTPDRMGPQPVLCS